MQPSPRALLLASSLFLACGEGPAGSGPTGDAATDDPSATAATTGATGNTTATGDPVTTGDPATTGPATTGPSTTGPSTTGPSTTGPSTTTDDTTTTTGPGACPGGGLGPGDHHIMIESGGQQRAAIVHVPPGYDAQKPTPLVVNMHGFTSNAEQQVAFSAMNPTADAHDFIVVYPDGLNNSWNAGGCCGISLQQNVDDVGFLRALVAHLEEQLCVDAARIYATGMSNGGYMSHRLACEASDLFAAVAPVSSSIGLPSCDPGRPVPILLFNGTADALVPYGGGLFPGAKEVFAGWAARNGCTGEPKVSKTSGTATCETYDTCDADATVTLCTLEGMGHCWPGQGICPYGAANTDLSANAEMWALFSQVTLP